jgi:hypothetical protein
LVQQLLIQSNDANTNAKSPFDSPTPNPAANATRIISSRMEHAITRSVISLTQVRYHDTSAKRNYGLREKRKLEFSIEKGSRHQEKQSFYGSKI